MIKNYRKIFFIGNLIISGLLGATLAVYLYRYDYLANGLLGIAAMYFMFVDSKAKEGAIDELLARSDKINGFLQVAISAFVVALAVRAIVRMVVFLIN